MIGQQFLIKRINQLRKADSFPKFCILVGPTGCGKKTLLREQFPMGVYLEDNRVESVRKMIELAYKTYNNVFIMPDADTMSNAAKNALLKVVEECPDDNYFIMTLEDENNTLETIRSRATIFRMGAYKPDDISVYYKNLCKGNVNFEDEQIVRDVCQTPGEVNLLMKYGIKDFYDYVQLVVDNIAEVTLANSFKIPSKVALKDGDEGYDLALFWKAFITIVVDRAIVTGEPLDVVRITSASLQQLRIKGVNRQMLMDCWILDVRTAWGTI